MQHTIKSCGLQQHIDQATHYLGHTLDILITRDTSNIVTACEVRDVGLCDNVGEERQNGVGVWREVATSLNFEGGNLNPPDFKKKNVLIDYILYKRLLQTLSPYDNNV